MSNCQVCHRNLKDPESVKRNMGPVCYRGFMAELEEQERQRKEEEENFQSFMGDIICERNQGYPSVKVNIPHRIVKHSPDGFEWGYGGSGPADLALNILAAYIGREKAEENGLYQEFKWDFIAPMPHKGGTIKRADVAIWLAKRGIQMPGFDAKELISA